MDTDDTIREMTGKQHGLVGRTQLFAAGVTGEEIAHRIARRHLEELSPRVLRLCGSHATYLQKAMAAVLDAPRAAFLSHHSAAAVWGIPGFEIGDPPQVVIPWQGRPTRRNLVQIHYHRRLLPTQLVVFDGCPITSPALTLYLLAGSVGPGRLERAVDNAIAQRLVSPTELGELLMSLAIQGRNGTRALRRLVEERLNDPVPFDSGLERRFETLAADVGLQVRRQVNLGGDVWLGRVDYLVEGTSHVIEVMSRRYHGSLSDRRRDDERRNGLTAEGFVVHEVWDDTIFHEPWRVLALLRYLAGYGSHPDLIHV